MKKTIALISGSSPKFLGGVSLYQINLINYAKKNNLNLDFTWIYPGDKNRKFKFEEINCVEIKSKKYPLLKEFDFARKAKKYLEKNNFDIINTHANWGYCLKNYNKKENKKIIHTYHGVTMPYMKIQFARFGLFKYLFYPLLPLFYFLEKPPMKKADKIICVSEKVKKDLEKLYSKREGMRMIRTGVDLSLFKKTLKQKARNDLSLEKNRIYGLYSGRGGYWNKGLDRAIMLGKEIYKQDNNFRLIVVGSDKNKCKKYLKENFIIYKGIVERNELNKFYSAADFFFSLSRYEGGAPTLALSEAIASECLAVCSKDMKPEILEDGRDCLILDSYEKENAEEILKLLEDKKKVSSMKKSALKKIKKLNLDDWGKEYFEVLLR